MDISLGNALSALFQSYYPGGMEAFNNGGGDVALVPSKKIMLIVYHPEELPVEFRNALDAFAKKCRITVSYTSLGCYGGQAPSPEQLDKLTTAIEALAQKFSIGLGPIALRVTGLLMSTDWGESKANAEEFAQELNKQIPGICRIFIINNDRELVLFEKAPVEKPRPKIVFESGQRKAVIGNDDLINLQIALNSARSFEEFLEQI